jgi:hypothetical protein
MSSEIQKKRGGYGLLGTIIVVILILVVIGWLFGR